MEYLIDCHVHFHNIGKVKDLIEIMKKLNYKRINIVSIISKERVNFNPEALYLKNLYPKKIYICGGLNYTKLLNNEPDTAQDLQKQIDTLREAGFDGIKMVEGKPSYYQYLKVPFDDKRYSLYFRHLSETKFPLLFHVGDPEEFWDPNHQWSKSMGWNYSSGDYPTLNSLYRQIDKVLENNPELVVIFAHFFFLGKNLDKADKYFTKFPNVHFDVTPGAEMYYQFSEDVERTRNFFIKWQDRILFGTDLAIHRIVTEEHLEGYCKTIRRLKKFFETSEEIDCFGGRPEFNVSGGQIKGINLPKEVYEKIYHKNFEKIFGKSPKKINKEKARQECLKIKNLIKEEETIKKLNEIISSF